MIILVEYGVGNIHSVRNALERAGAQIRVSSDPAVIARADRVVLPGVGAFGDGMQALQKRNLVAVLTDFLQSGRPFLGICLGMQLLFEQSEEIGTHHGFGYLRGRVRRFPAIHGKIPHTGWNQITIKRQHPLLKNIPDGSYTYFNHSYICEPDPQVITTSTDYDISFPSMVASGTVMGVQFHPEKSQSVGLQMLKNFVEYSQ